jgi:hypothetical protein
MGKQLSKPDLLIQAKVSYGKALILINAALSDPQAARTDEVLLTISLIGFYEFNRPEIFLQDLYLLCG